MQSFPISRLDLIGTKLTEIPSLSRLPLRWLGLNNNPITDLSPLRGLNLRFLSIDGCKVKDLGPLAGMPLEELHISTNYLANLEPLRGMRLRVLQAKANKIRDLEPLTGMPLEEVDLGGNPFESLEPLRGAPLKSLQVGGIPKASDASFFLAFPTLEEIALPYVAFNVEPLRQLPALKRIAISGIQKQPIPAAEFWAAYQPDWCAPGIVRQRLEQAGVKLGSKSNHVSRMPDGTLDMVLGISNLERLDFFDGFRVSKLDIGFTKVRDLALLRGHPLTWLRINSTPVTDLRPLLDCPTLEILCLPRQAQNVEVLKQLPKLRRLSYDWDVASNQPAQTAEEFWKDYDAKKAAGK